jgi:hypothetical protein
MKIIILEVKSTNHKLQTHGIMEIRKEKNTYGLKNLGKM